MWHCQIDERYLTIPVTGVFRHTAVTNNIDLQVYSGQAVGVGNADQLKEYSITAIGSPMGMAFDEV